MVGKCVFFCVCVGGWNSKYFFSTAAASGVLNDYLAPLKPDVLIKSKCPRSICFLSGIPEIAHTSTLLPLSPTVTAPFDMIAWSHSLCQSYTWSSQYRFWCRQTFGLLLCTLMFVHLDRTNTSHKSQSCVKNPKEFTSLKNVRILHIL